MFLHKWLGILLPWQGSPKLVSGLGIPLFSPLVLLRHFAAAVRSFRLLLLWRLCRLWIELIHVFSVHYMKSGLEPIQYTISNASGCLVSVTKYRVLIGSSFRYTLYLYGISLCKAWYSTYFYILVLKPRSTRISKYVFNNICMNCFMHGTI